jgi:hypothetical protein
VLEAIEIAAAVVGAICVLAFFLAPSGEEWTRQDKR